MAIDSYRTVADRAEASHRVRGSRFVGIVAPVDSVQSAEEMITGVAADHPDATHVVPAYRVRSDPFREYSSDDGEPSGSAGKPILSVLQGRSLENVVCVVVRYYGGTNLGVGGLVRSYQEASKRAIDATEVVERRPHVTLQITTEYNDSGTVRGILEGSDAEFQASYDEAVSFDVRVPVDRESYLRERLLDATSGRVEMGPP